MSQINDMAMTIEELCNAAAAINEAANWLAEQFSGTTKNSVSAMKNATNKEKKQNSRLKMYAMFGQRNPVQGIQHLFVHYFRSYGASKLSAVDHKYYEALLKDAEVLDDVTKMTRPSFCSSTLLAKLPSFCKTM